MLNGSGENAIYVHHLFSQLGAFYSIETQESDGKKLRNESQRPGFFVRHDLGLAAACCAHRSKIIIESLRINFAVLTNTSIGLRNVCSRRIYSARNESEEGG